MNNIKELDEYSLNHFDFIQINLKKIDIVMNNINSISSLEQYI